MTTLLVAIAVVRLVFWETQHFFAMPIFDDFYDHMKMYKASGSLSAFIKYLFSNHNEHHILTTRILAVLDEFYLGGREHLQIITSNLLQILSAFIVWRAYIYPMHRLNAQDAVWIFLTIVLFFLNGSFLSNLIFPFQVQHFIMNFLCLWAAFFIAKASANEGELFTSFLVKIVLLAAIATVTLGNAPAILIAATIAAFVFRWSWRKIATLAVLAGVHIAVGILLAKSTIVGPRNLMGIIQFACVYLGGPLVRLDPWPASYVTWSGTMAVSAITGFIIIAIGIVSTCVRFVRPGFGGTPFAFGFVLLTMVGITAVAAGYQRLPFGVAEGASPKYSTFSVLGWLGVMMIFVGWARHVFGIRHKMSDAVIVCALFVLLPLSYLGYARETRIWKKALDVNWEASMAVFLQINVKSHLVWFDPQFGPALAIYVEKYVKPHGRGIFSYYPFRWGDDANAVAAGRHETPCRGMVETIRRLPPDELTNVFHVPGSVFSVSGFTWMENDRGPAKDIVVVDSDNHIVGLAHSTRTSASAEESFGQKFDVNLGWFGFVRVETPSQLRFFALSSDGKSFCALSLAPHMRFDNHWVGTRTEFGKVPVVAPVN
ncbi:MAG: hypothetical protein HY537_06815 [Deltaproteobacteria bacterium]|nr:hypothetical protein [Deltaproteobacteria bacterium]